MLRSILIGIAAVAGAAAPAWASDATCMWENLSAAQRDNMLSAYEQAGKAALENAISQDEIAEVGIRCMPPVDEASVALVARRMSLSFAYLAIEKASADYLVRAWKVPPGSLDLAWGQLSPGERQSLRGAANGQADQEALARIVLKAARATGWRPTNSDQAAATIPYFVDHFGGRAMRENAESGLSPPPPSR